MKDKPIDNTAVLANQKRRANRLNSIKHGLETGSIKEWDQIFAIITETRLSIELCISFYVFRKKWKDPGEFTRNELMRFAELVNVKYDIIDGFIWNLIRNNFKGKASHE